MSERSISLDRMEALLRARSAFAVIESTAPPVRYADHWWTVSQGSAGEEYRPVRDSRTIALLDDAAERLAMARSAMKRRQ